MKLIATLAAVAASLAVPASAMPGHATVGRFCGEVSGTLQGNQALKSYECWDVTEGTAPNIRVIAYRDPIDQRMLFARKVVAADGTYELFDDTNKDPQQKPAGRGTCVPKDGGYLCRSVFGSVLIYGSGTIEDQITETHLDVKIEATYAWGWKVFYQGRLVRQP